MSGIHAEKSSEDDSVRGGHSPWIFLGPLPTLAEDPGTSLDLMTGFQDPLYGAPVWQACKRGGEEWPRCLDDLFQCLQTVQSDVQFT